MQIEKKKTVGELKMGARIRKGSGITANDGGKNSN